MENINEIKILFLDIDWVILPIWNNAWNWNLKDIPMHIYDFLNELYKQWVNFIIHSSWREYPLDLKEFWKYNNLPNYIWNTSLEVSKEEWILQILDNIYFDIKNKNDTIIKAIIIDDNKLDLENIYKKFNNNKIKIEYIMPNEKKWIMWKEISKIKDFLDIK